MDRYSWHHKIYAVQITKKYTIMASTSISPYLCTLLNINFDLLGCVCVGGGGGGGGRRSHQSGSRLDAHLASTSFSASIF